MEAPLYRSLCSSPHRQAVSSAVVGLVDAADMVKNYTILLKKALDDSNPEKKTAWEAAVRMSLEKDKLLSSATEAYGNAKNALIIALQAVEGGRQNAKTRCAHVVTKSMMLLTFLPAFSPNLAAEPIKSDCAPLSFTMSRQSLPIPETIPN